MTVREEFLAASVEANPSVVVPLPEEPLREGQPQSMRLRCLNGFDYLKYIDAIEGMERGQAMYLLIVFSAVDDEGRLLFSEADIPALKAKKLKTLLRLQAAAMQINGMGEDLRVKNA